MFDSLRAINDVRDRYAKYLVVAMGFVRIQRLKDSLAHCTFLAEKGPVDAWAVCGFDIERTRALERVLMRLF
jgi:hypothetical protein